MGILFSGIFHPREHINLNYRSKLLPYSDSKARIIDILKGNDSSDKKYKSIRKVVENSRLQDFTELYSYLFEKVDEYGKNKSSSIILLLAEGQYRESMIM